MSRYRIHWVLTHDPIALFEEAARRFQSLVHERSNGEIEVRVSTPTEYGNGTRVPADEVMRKVVSGELEMSQTYTTTLGRLAERLWALDLPFLFHSHEHAARVIDGRIGRELLDELEPHGLHGLAFTYSGGYRIVSSTGAAIRRIEDFAGLRVRTAENPVVTALFESLGAHPVPAPLPSIPALTEAGKIEAAESTWPRYWDMGHHAVQAVVNETSHSLFLTALTVNARFFASLPEHLKEVLSGAARETAYLERDKSVRDGLECRKACLEAGGVVHTLSRAESQRFERAAKPIHERFRPVFGNELLDRIQSAAFSASA
jgi:TRAP-type C4-dicarboxylate transport system substrate-binding protein